MVPSTDPIQTTTLCQNKKALPHLSQDGEQAAEGLFLPAFTRRIKLGLLGHASFRGFQRVQFERIFFDFFLDVGGEIAGTFRPLDGGLTIGFAIASSSIFHCSITSFARLHDGITSPTVVGTAVLLHEHTFCSHLNCLTNHDQLPPFTAIYLPELTGNDELF
jgi:hypothetical protein